MDEKATLPGEFKDKVVIVGPRLELNTLGGRSDHFNTPHASNIPGAEIHTAAFLNLWRGDWLRCMSLPAQFGIVGLWGGLIVLPWIRFRSRTALLVSVGAALLLACISIILLHQHARIWWSWLIPVALQMPVALAGGVWIRLKESSAQAVHVPILATAFISYRREGGADTARLIREALLKRGVKAFLDVDDLGAKQFDERLLTEIERAPHFILILSPGALDRCADPNDWVRREIAHALKHQRNVVPVLREGFVFPSPESLPDDIAELPRYNCVIYSHEFFDATMGKIFRFLND